MRSANSTSPAHGAPKVVPSRAGLGDRRDDRRVRVAEDQRAPGAHEIEVACCHRRREMLARRRAR